MAVETNVALLGYGTVGAAVDRLLAASADDIERATGHRLRLVRALVRDPARHTQEVQRRSGPVPFNRRGRRHESTTRTAMPNARTATGTQN